MDNDGDGLYNQEEKDLCRNPDSASDFALEFNSDNDIFNDNIQRNITGFQEIGGVVKGTSSSGDSQILKNQFLNMSGSEISAITVRMKANIATTRLQLFWENEDGNFSATRTVFQDYTGNGNWQVLSLDVSTNNQWQGKIIKGLRIDPTNNSGVDFEIDWIRTQDAIDPALPCTPLSVDDFVLESGINLYPNPVASGQIINFKGLETYNNIQIVVYDITGKMIQSQKGNNTLTFNNVKAGMYFVRFNVVDKNQVVIKKLIVK
jgi:hypothetical protein